MQLPSLFAQAFLPASDPLALPDALTLQQLALLRASSDEGLDHDLYERLLKRLPSQAERGLFTVERRATEVPSGCYLVTRTVDDGWRQSETETCLVQCLSGGPPKGATKHFIKGPDELVITKIAAQALFKVDPENWREGALSWAGIEVVASAGEGGRALDRELSSTALRTELFGGGRGTIRDAAGRDIEWRNVLENKTLVEKAKVPGKKAGKESVWHLGRFRETLHDLAYTIEPAAPARASAGAGRTALRAVPDPLLSVLGGRRQ